MENILVNLQGETVEFPVAESVKATLEQIEQEAVGIDSSYEGKKLRQDANGVYTFTAPHGEAGTL